MTRDLKVIEKPIIFNGQMIRAILDGRKSVTRRVIKAHVEPCLNPGCSDTGGYGEGDPHGDFEHVQCQWCWTKESSVFNLKNKCLYGQPGDRLVVAKEIPDIPKKYCAGSDGKIYSKASGEWKPLKVWYQPKGYPSVTISNGKTKKSLTVHRLVCAAFYGSPLYPATQVRHLDGNPANGSPENLAWGTQEENWLDRKAHGRGSEGEKHHAATLTNEERAHVRWAIQQGLCSQKHAARMLGLTQGSVSQLMEGCELVSYFCDDAKLIKSRIPPINLEITNIGVERVQGITSQSIWYEGAPRDKDVQGQQDWFRDLWDSINEKRGYGWDTNPWVWVIEFKRLEP